MDSGNIKKYITTLSPVEDPAVFVAGRERKGNNSTKERDV